MCLDTHTGFSIKLTQIEIKSLELTVMTNERKFVADENIPKEALLTNHLLTGGVLTAVVATNVVAMTGATESTTVFAKSLIMATLVSSEAAVCLNVRRS